MRQLLLPLCLLAASVFGGNSLTLGTATVTNSSVAAVPGNAACRMEAFLHGVNSSPTSNTHSVSMPACGLDWQWINSGGSDIKIQFYSLLSSGGSVCQIPVYDYLTDGFYLRVQIDPDGAGGAVICQAWDTDGTRFFSESKIYTGSSGSNSNGVTVTGAGTAKDISWGFLKLFTTNVGLQARMPVHGEDGDLLSWRFDSDLTDDSGNSYTGTHSGSPSYTSTPGQTLVLGVVKTNPAPTWTDRRTMRVGVNNAITGADSYSQADASPTVTCDWSVQSTTPSMGLTLTIDDATNNCTPNFNPNAFGDYLVRLTVTDTDMNTSMTDVHMGAVNMNASGVVQPTDANVTKIFGPMIALGWNPWGLEDERHVFAHTARRADYLTASTTSPSYSLGNPEWDTAKTGTVAYTWNGKGVGALGGTGTTTTGAVNTTDLSIPIAEANVLDLSTLPTKILIQATSTSYAFEEIDICSTTATSGAATLTVCYDGRGKNDGSGMASVLGPTSWSSGAVVGQAIIKGTGTDFVGGAEKLCEAGAGPMGPITYQTGTVSVTANSASITGSGTTWNTGNGAVAGYAVRIQGTHSSTPFIFYAYITSVDSTTGITMNRVFPADADTASGLTYQIVRPWFRLPVTGFTRPTFGGTALFAWGGTSCADDTQAFFNIGFNGNDNGDLNGDSITGQVYSYQDADSNYINSGSTGGVNFYGEDLAWYALHFRSGLAEPKTTAEMLANHWVHYPGLRGGVGSLPVYSPLFEGGGVIGGITCLVLDADCDLTWPDVRGFIGQGEYYALNGTCLSWDSRDGGYLGTWLALGAVHDPDNTYRTQWRNALDDLYTLEDGCKGDNSWANSFYFNTSGGSGTLTNGSAAVTGSGFTSGMCYGVASGNFSISGSTLTATSGTFSSTAAHVNIVLNDGTYRLFTRITYTDSTHATLHAAWPGAATGTWLQLDAPGEGLLMTAWGESSADADLEKNYECTFNSSTSLTLERAWTGNTATHYRYTSNLAGKGQQPFMLAIKSYGFQVASELDATLSTDFTTLRDEAGTWVANTGYDTEVHGIRYGAVFQSCEPSTTAVGTHDWKQPGCTYGQGSAVQVASRMLNAEAGRAFLYNTTNTTTRGLDAYGAVWCSTDYNDDSLYPSIAACDSVSPGDNLGLSNMTDASLGGGKWPGFFFGMGMAHQWPAELFGVASPTPTINGKFSLGGKISFR